MTNKLNILLGAVAAAALFTPAASASEEDLSSLVVDQVQLGDVWSGMNVHVGEYTEGDVKSVSAAVGNTASGSVMSGDVDVNVTQTMNGNAEAVNDVSGGDVYGGLHATTTSYANAVSASTWSGNTGQLAYQENTGTVSGTTNINVRNVGHIASSTTAIANVSTPSSEFGDNRSFTEQKNSGSSYATTNATVCCDNDGADFSTIAGGNAVTSNGYSSTVLNGAVQQQAQDTEVVASSNVYFVNANNVSASATATANSYTLHNAYAYATLGRDVSPLYQGNYADVSAESNVSLDHWNGHATSTAYGVGNSALIGNFGADTGLYANQENAGTVSATANFDGTSFTGGAGSVDATAIGNAATATLCNVCGDAVLHGSINQTNYSATNASANIYAGQSGNIYGSATAIGNSATFTASGD